MIMTRRDIEFVANFFSSLDFNIIEFMGSNLTFSKFGVNFLLINAYMGTGSYMFEVNIKVISMKM